MNFLQCCLSSDFFSFSMLKEREAHESVRIVSKKLKLEEKPVLQEKLKATRGTQQ